MNNETVNVTPYLMYEGDCEDALNFYTKILGVELVIVSRYDQPEMNAPASYQHKILHARLESGGQIILYASDTFPGKTTHKTGGDVSLSLMFHDSLDRAKKVFNDLAAGGKVGFPFEKQFWGAWHGSLTDQYGFNWNVNYE
ncbi:VOC family protein [Chitinophaga sp. 212800010-3]|uniref:VOC family protein n=1 Tax=unclassified Chitinophaga TaxID=2619133 RepID=UPI002DEA3EBE|nr:3-dmu-9-3-mt domain-containing protein [Chitinophaga sp. 212800010-3]